MDECSAGLCPRGQFACGDILEAFDDGLHTVRAPVRSVWGQTVFPEPLCPTISVSGGMNLIGQLQLGEGSWGTGCLLEGLWVLLAKRADARNAKLVDRRHP